MLEQIRKTDRRITPGHFVPGVAGPQMPVPLGGGLVKAGWFRRYAADEVPPFERIVQSWDTASKATELSDYSVCTSWGMRARTFISSTYCASAWSMPR